MKFRKSLLVALCAATLGTAAPLIANAEVRIYLNSAPPEVRYESVPAARRGYIWSPGYWNVKNKRHVWQAGYWQRERKGYHYIQPAWTQRDNRWQLERGRWNRGDRDGDGVPNRLDRAPDNPRRN
jgi:YXWGXW repeat-containing protein